MWQWAWIPRPMEQNLTFKGDLRMCISLPLNKASVWNFLANIEQMIPRQLGSSLKNIPNIHQTTYKINFEPITNINMKFEIKVDVGFLCKPC